MKDIMEAINEASGTVDTMDFDSRFPEMDSEFNNEDEEIYFD